MTPIYSFDHCKNKFHFSHQFMQLLSLLLLRYHESIHIESIQKLYGLFQAIGWMTVTSTKSYNSHVMCTYHCCKFQFCVIKRCERKCKLVLTKFVYLKNGAYIYINKNKQKNIHFYTFTSNDKSMLMIVLYVILFGIMERFT